MPTTISFIELIQRVIDKWDSGETTLTIELKQYESHTNIYANVNEYRKECSRYYSFCKYMYLLMKTMANTTIGYLCSEETDKILHNTVGIRESYKSVKKYKPKLSDSYC